MVDLVLESETQLVTVEDNSPSLSVLWDRAVQQAVINTSPGPTIASRAYGMVHRAIYDAWSAYDPVAIATTSGDDWQQPTAEITEANKQAAMSYAAYGVLVGLFPREKPIFDALMLQLGYDPHNHSVNLDTPALIGNYSAESILQLYNEDNHNNYIPLNSSPEKIIDIAQWTPEHIPLDDLKAGLQQFLTPHWGNLTTFAPESSTLLPEPPEPFLLVEGEVDLTDKTVTLKDGSIIPIHRDLIGTIINPEFIAQAEQVIEYSGNLTDEEKLIAEFWEDPGGTSFPPGTWMTFGQYVSARDDHTLDDDAKMFFILGNAVFDASVATWKAKTYYNYARPVRTIRTLGELGLIGEYNDSLGGYAIAAWQPNLGTQTILATDFLTYQTPGSDPSPPFAEYTSGHSAFSAASAEVLRRFTGRDFFGAEVTFDVGSSRFEPELTPEDTITLSWDTFSEAADQAGISRLYGGIHFADGDLNGRILGREIGDAVFEEAQFYINGGIRNPEPIFGTVEDDMIKIINSPGIVLAGDGNDVLIAGENDRLLGENGNDILLSFQGSNILTGGEGEDRFWILVNSDAVGIDTITDFDLNEDLLGIGDFSISFEELIFTETETGTIVSSDRCDLVFLEHIAPTNLHSSHFGF